MIIDRFYDWILTLEASTNCNWDVKAINFDNNNIVDSTLKKTIVIDTTSNKYIGRFIAWDDNSCSSELIEIDTEKNILFERLDYTSLTELKYQFDTFINYL